MMYHVDFGGGTLVPTQVVQVSMHRQLDILALEPYFGGVRRSMLETLTRCSRHRWTLMTLPPRRMERRLAAAAHWFTEQLARKASLRIDVLFTGDGLNLADLYRMCPAVRDHPSVCYFHSNQLPDVTQAVSQRPMDLTNLTTATAATEIWFNSKHHVGSFIEGVKDLVSLHKELQMRDPVDDLLAKLHLVPPPVDTQYYREVVGLLSQERDPMAVFVETRDANMELLNGALEILHQQKREISLMVCGPVRELVARFPTTIVSETDAAAQVRALLIAGTFVSAKIAAPFDENAVRGMSLGCRPVLPHTGIYPELVPVGLHSECLYDMSADSLASHIHESTYLPALYGLEELTSRLKPYECLPACGIIDQRLDALATAYEQEARASHHSLREARRRAIPNA
jgi:Holliday junction resolvase-like predicted endonuclease